MLNLDDRSKLEQVQEQQFVEACKEEFIEKSLAATNARKVRTLTLISYLPNLISATTAGFFVVFLLGGYPRPIAILLGGLLLAVVAAVEIGKRGLIADISKTYFVRGKVAALGIIALCILIAVSMGASYQGGRQLITETDTPPAKEINPEIATLSAQLATQQETIERLQRTTWKGKVTRDAVKGINQAKQIEAALLERITALQAADAEAYSAVLAAHDGQRLNFGYLLGVLAALADAFLLGLLFTAKRLKFEVAAINYRQAHSSQASTGSAYLTGREAVQIPPPSLNEKKERRPIGFYRDDPDEDALRMHCVDASEDQADGTQCVEVEKPGGKVKGCAYCGEMFEAKTTWHKYCSEECRIAAWEERTGKTWKKSNS